MTGVAQPWRQEDGHSVLETLLTGQFDEKADIEATKRALTVALGTVAHEMATPLAIVRMDLQTIREKLEGSALGAAVEPSVLHAFGQLSSTYALMQMMLASVSDPATLARSFSEHSALDVVYRVLRDWSRDEPVDVRHEQGDFTFHGSDMLMAHVLLNLLENAHRAIFGIKGAGVSVHLVPGAEANHLLVRDTGRGIPESFLPYLFQPFRTRAQGGNGLGLAFCRRVVTAFGGEITCRSEVGKFTEFDVALPAFPTAWKAT